MFCKHCGHKLTDGAAVCPGCGTRIDPAVFSVQKFKVTLPSREQELQTLLEQVDAKKAEAAPATEVIDLPEEVLELSPDVPEDAPPTVVELPEEDDALLRQPMISDGRTPTPRLDISVPADLPLLRPRESAASRRSRHVLTAIVCVCAVAMLALLGVRLTTHLFDSSNSGLEPVSLNVLTDEEKQEVLSALLPYAPLFDRPFTPTTMGVGAFFRALDLNKTNNLYAAANGQPTRVTETADPLSRFVGEEGGYSYYRIPAKELDALAARFGVSLPGSGNNSSYYYYDGAYYFFAADEPAGDPAPDLHVSKAQNTEDGNCYVVLADLSDINVVYAIVSRGTDAAQAADWTVLELSPDPLFREDGSRLAVQSDALPYEMRHTEIPATASDGTVYAKYVLDYPYFTDTATETAKTVNALYAQMLNSYRELSQSADKRFQAFVKRGYDTRMLPGYTYMVSTVTFNRDGTLSLLDELTEYQAEAAAKALKAQQAESSAEEEGEEPLAPNRFVMPTITYSGTTIDTGTGAFLRRDDLFSGDFAWYQTLLYHVFAGASEADLDALISGATAQTETTGWEEETTADPYAPTAAEDVTAATDSAAAGLPALSDAQAAVGQQIYASPWVRTEEGVCFCYLGNGYYSYVTLPEKYVEAE